MTKGAGFLAIWSDVEPAEETDYLHWLTREHTAERVGLPGFLGVRVFRARLVERCRYLILYSLDNPGILSSEPYLARLNAPTAWSRRIMPILRNFVRGGGRVVAEFGSGEGMAMIPIICRHEDAAVLQPVLRTIVALDRIVSARLLEVERSGTEIATNERAMRTNDRSFPALLLIEALSDSALDAALDEVGKTIGVPTPAERYDQVFALAREGLARARTA